MFKKNVFASLTAALLFGAMPAHAGLTKNDVLFNGTSTTEKEQ
jgi:hypothetical protein